VIALGGRHGPLFEKSLGTLIIELRCCEVRCRKVHVRSLLAIFEARQQRSLLHLLILAHRHLDDLALRHAETSACRARACAARAPRSLLDRRRG
jgi:hypothetical protein